MKPATISRRPSNYTDRRPDAVHSGIMFNRPAQGLLPILILATAGILFMLIRIAVAYLTR